MRVILYTVFIFSAFLLASHTEAWVDLYISPVTSVGAAALVTFKGGSTVSFLFETSDLN